MLMILRQERAARTMSQDKLSVFSMLLLVLAIVKGSSAVTVFKIGNILIGDSNSPYDMERVGPAIDLGLEKVNRDILNVSYRLEKISTIHGKRCEASNAAGMAADMYYSGKIIGMIGPACTHALELVANLAGYWNISIVTGLGDSGRFKDKTNFPTLTRMAYCQCRLRKVFGGVFTRFNWTDIVLIYDANHVHSEVLATTLKEGLQKQWIYPHTVRFYGNTQVDYDKDILQPASEHGRIIILSVHGDKVRDIMLAAYDNGYLRSNEYVFMDVELFEFGGDYWGSHAWYRGDSRDDDARRAYEAMLRITLYEPHGEAWNDFTNDVKMRAKRDYNFDYGSEKVNFFVATFYDSVMIFGMALNETIETGGEPTDGFTLTRRMWNREFLGITERVLIDGNGDRDTSYTIQDMNPATGKFEVVAHYWGHSPGYTPVPDRSIHWPGRSTPPDNVPRCWFKGDNPACLVKEPLSVYTVVLTSLLFVTLVSAVVAFSIYRKVKFEAGLSNMAWRAKHEDIKIIRKPNGLLGSKSFLSLATDGTSHKSHGNQIFTEIAVFQGTTVAVHAITKRVSVDRKLLMEIKQLRDLTHDNVNRFCGACVDHPNECLLMEYCSKGSLQDILANDSINLDSTFKLSLIEDIVKGMAYIHSTSIRFHGRFHSSNCVIDSRFVLKITDFGLPSLSFQSETDDDLHAMMLKQLWVAPELLRIKSTGFHGTPEGDVYSFGIILSEIATRLWPYERECVEYSTEEIIEKVLIGETPPFRPTQIKWDCSPDLEELMKQAWNENADERPCFSVIHKMIKKCNKGKITGILDNLLKRMEQYANNLESIVEERTQQLIDEKKRSDTLLHAILPKSIASQLIEGRPVKPESYDSVSIYFSDIVGFTSLSSASTPLQVVNLLNDLYTCFDAIIDNYDVYKVETIGDAYMVVSGLPTRNGNKHADEICRMALALLTSTATFRIRHKPDMKLQLRIGVHSGSCVAGVVGLKMPRYCLFGDTVNTAARMESNGLPLRIHVHPSTKRLLDKCGEFQFQERGEVEMKGKGVVHTYWLLGETTDEHSSV